jgi:hypothetical protein
MILTEYNKKDIDVLKELDNQFTIAFEFELETDDSYKPEDSDDELTIEQIRTSVHNQLRDDKRANPAFIDNIVDQIELDDEDFTYDELLNPSYYSNRNEKRIIDVIRAISMEHTNDNLTYLSMKVKEYLPNFYDKWSDKMKFEVDSSLDRGIEFSPLTYLNSVSESIDMVNDFYNDFDNQSYWKFTEKTGLHINIGFKEKMDWNVLKGVLFLSDDPSTSKNKVPYVFKGIEERVKSKYAGSFKRLVFGKVSEEKDTFTVNKQNLKDVEKYFNEYLLNLLDSEGYESPTYFKLYGFNITRLKKYNYIEFRYPGGPINREVLIDKLFYFCHLCALMTKPDYKKEQYYKRLYSFLKLF